MEPILRSRRLLEPPPRPRQAAEERCEMCGAPLSGPHSHVVESESRRILCACRPCYLLFTHPGAGGGRFRSIPERYIELPELARDAARWEALDIPVGMAFLLRQNSPARLTAFYPSPTGATERSLPPETWLELAAARPELATLEDEVEGLLVCRKREPPECWIAPVDACYELVGRVRRHWRGFQGGPEAWREIDAFFDSLRGRRTGRREAWTA